MQNIKLEIFCCKLFLNYANNKHSDTHIHVEQPLKMCFSDTENIKTRKSIKIPISKIRPQNNAFSTLYGYEKVIWNSEGKK